MRSRKWPLAEALERAPRRRVALGPSRAADQVRLTVLRLARAWRERVENAQARLAAADAIIAAVPDPLILLDARRRVIHANAAAEEMFGGELNLERDLAAALRNPAVLAAVDAVLRGEGLAHRRIRPDLAGRAPAARPHRPHRPNTAEGAVAMLRLHDMTSSKRGERMRADVVANASHELRTRSPPSPGLSRPCAGRPVTTPKPANGFWRS